MAIFLSTLEHSSVPIEVREILSFSRGVCAKILAKAAKAPSVEGAVLLSTCNRTELYVSSGAIVNPGAILCDAADIAYAPFAPAFQDMAQEQAVSHLMEVAAGIRSRILGEDQIISQVRDAICIAREQKCACGELETLFRTAVSAGKEVKNRVPFSALPTSAASAAVARIAERRPIAGSRAMVIGNGKMGRLAAQLLTEMGCDVTVTLRTYRHGETIVPRGCRAVAYETRYAAMDSMDFVISATTSPHYTITQEEVSALSAPPAIFVDLSIPRDIQPAVGQIPGVEAFNVDDLAEDRREVALPPLLREILQTHEKRFYRWLHYRDCMPAAEELKDAILCRLLRAQEMEEHLSPELLLDWAVDRTVDLIVGGCADKLTAHSLEGCSAKIRLHTTAGRKAI